MAGAINHSRTSVTNHQTVAAPLIADVDTRIRPGRVGSRHQHAVVGGIGVEADIASLIDHTALTTNHQTVAAAIVADENICRIGPGRVRPRYCDDVVGGDGEVAEKASLTHRPAPITDDQTVAAAIKADIEIARISPGRVCPRHQHAVVGG